MKKAASVLIVLVFTLLALSGQSFRAPSVPLVAHDPYFSIWSPADRLYDRETVHWTGKEQPLHSMVMIDGLAYRIMGSVPSNLQPLNQTSVTIYPTSTKYTFANEKIRLQLTFTTPSLPSDLDILSRPVTYITWQVESADHAAHEVKIYFDCGAEIAVNTADQNVVCDNPVLEGLQTLRVGNPDQPVLGRRGDDVRIDCGYGYLCVPSGQHPEMCTGTRKELIKTFMTSGNLSGVNKLPSPVSMFIDRISMASVWSLGTVTDKVQTCWAMLAYDDVSAIRYFDSDLKAWWKRKGMKMEELLPVASADYLNLTVACERFDAELMKDLTKAGGEKYAVMASLVYRQCLAAHKLVSDGKDTPLMFPKENFSNGCIGTVDVIYPASPFFLLFNSTLTRATLQPVFDYASSPRWKFPFAPHDLGQYPYATGQVYGGGERTEENQMPVEETGNMIIITAALARIEGNADFANTYWTVLEKWSNYLLSKGFDPENQLCTDDFAGHLAHNINLSAKAIIALGCYAQLCEMTGRKEEASQIRSKTEGMVKEWLAKAAEGDHTRLAFDQHGTWSQKYNLVWDRLLGLHLFPNDMIQKEIQWYKTRQVEFGIPLDNRERYTKNDWITWTATMADQQDDFRFLFNPVYHYAESTPNRVPLSDWYIADNAYMVGFQARSVVGGFFIKMLADPALWKKWNSLGGNAN